MTSRQTPVRPARAKHEKQRNYNSPPNATVPGRPDRQTEQGKSKTTWHDQSPKSSKSSNELSSRTNGARRSNGNGRPRESPNTRQSDPPPGRSPQSDVYDNVGIQDQNSLTKEFMDATGAMDLTLATDILAGKDWKLNDAIAFYDQIKVDSTTSSTISTTSDQPLNQAWSSPSSNSLSSSKLSSTASGSTVSRERVLLRGLSKVYDLKDGAIGMEIDKQNALNTGSDTNTLASKQLNVNLGLDNSYMIPDLSTLPTDLADYIEKELVDFVTMNILERTGHINWWAQHSLSTRLWPLHTSGDGNCLLHAASLAMWGVQDKFLQLRQKLDRLLQKQTTSGPLYRRWRWQQTQSNMEMSLIYTEEEWQTEWENLLSLSSLTKKVVDFGDEQREYIEYLEFLEEFHVYVLAQILKRPIIVFADSVLRDVDGYPLSPVPFGGIYLPLECKPKDCHATPLLLAYDRSHFTAVVAMAPSRSKKEKNPMRDLVPLTGPDCDLLPMHFFVDPGPDVDWNNLPEDSSSMMSVIMSVEDFMEVRKIPLEQIQSGDGSVGGVTASEGANPVAKSSSSSSVGSRESDRNSKGNVMETLITKLKPNNTKKSGSVKDAKNPAPSDVELEPGNELIMCAKLTNNTPKSYTKDVEKYLAITKSEFETKKAQGRLPDPKKIPLIATKDYAKTLSLQPPHSSAVEPSTAVSPGSGTVCRQCRQYLGTEEQDNLCSLCYQPGGHSGRSQPCKNCHKFQGTKEQHYYCSTCYTQILSGERPEGEQTNNSNVSDVAEDRVAEYAIEIPEGNPKEYKDYQMSSVHAQHPGEYLQEYPANVRGGIHHHHTYAGNPSLVREYDRSMATGYTLRPEFVDNNYYGHMSLGMDPVQPHQLHMVPPTRSNYQLDRPDMQTSRYDPGYQQQRQQQTIPIPVHHHPPSNSPTQPRSPKPSSPFKSCRSCNNVMPVDEIYGMCRRCRPRAAQQSVTMKQVRSKQLEKCIRVGCFSPACSNLGLCKRCFDSEKRIPKPKHLYSY